MADIGYNNTEYLVDKFLNDILRLSFVYVRNIEDAQDVAQQVFITYLQKKPVFENDQHAKNWLFKVAVNISKNCLRSRHSTVSLDELENVLTTDDTEYYEKSEAEHAVLHAVLCLKPSYREIIHLYYYMDYDTNEIANILNIPAASVRARLVRARNALEKLLKGEKYFDKQLQECNEPCESQ